MEVASQRATSIEDCGYVAVVCGKGATIWESDPKLFAAFGRFTRNCVPVVYKAAHICHKPAVCKFIKPVYYAVIDKRSRSRTIIHDAEGERQTLDALSEYGIPADVLPIVMGGTVELNMPEWILERRCVEIEGVYNVHPS